MYSFPASVIPLIKASRTFLVKESSDGWQYTINAFIFHESSSMLSLQAAAQNSSFIITAVSAVLKK
jgi:hypothetical protein